MRSYTLKKYKPLVIVISICVIAILAWILYAPYGSTKYIQISTDLENVSVDIETLKDQNKVLHDEINRLKDDNQYIEDVARKEYGLLKKNEMVFEFKK